MRELPTGTITYLFTDVEGSTRLWEEHPEEMRAALARHDALVQAIVAAHSGIIIRDRGEGDSFFAVFTCAVDAVRAACVLQRALTAEAWPEETPIRVRCALHTGTSELRDGSYYGAVVNRCARLRAAAHGGQTLVAHATYELVRNRIPGEITLRGLGTHRLKDLLTPEAIYQLEHPELNNEFPPLRTLEAYGQNLPLQSTSFVGREKELRDVQRLLSGTRLLTLTGAGGCGKTRLMLQSASDALGEYADGVWLVELAPLADGALLPQTVASALGVAEEAGQELLQSLIEYLRSRELLLLLDNCEHLVDHCAALVDRLLSNCGGLHVMVTSREVLRVPGEVTYEVPPLGLPECQVGMRGDERIGLLRRYDATRLFLDRACAVVPSFSPEGTEVQAIVQICQRLDGIPLAIELAAPWVRALAVEQIAERLDDCFRLLTRGRRTALPRQQTLQALIDWSYDLLTPSEQALLRRAAVFSGGWTIVAIVPIASDLDAMGTIGDDDVIDLLFRLVEKSLVNVTSGAGVVRYRLFETVRQYGMARLIATGEAPQLLERHRDWFLQFAENASRNLTGSEQSTWLKRLEEERDNLRAALKQLRDDPAGAEATVRMASALWRFWYMRGYRSEWFGWLDRAIRHPGISDAIRIRALSGAGILSWAYGDYAAAQAYHKECLERRQALGDLRGIASSLNNLGLVAVSSGDHALARSYFEQCLPKYREVGDDQGVAAALTNLGSISLEMGDFEEAQRLNGESEALHRKLGDLAGVATALHNLGEVALRQGDYRQAAPTIRQALSLRTTLGDRRGMLSCLFALAELAARVEDRRTSIILFAATAAARPSLAAPLSADDERKWQERLEQVRTEVGDGEFSRMWQEGDGLSLEAAGQLAQESQWESADWLQSRPSLDGQG